MTQEEVHASLDKMLENQKSRNFLNHLVRSYMPVSNINKVMNKPEGEFKCAISRDSLISMQEILDGVRTEEFKVDLMNSLKNMFDEKADKTTPMAKFIGDKKVAVTGVGTTTFLSVTVAQELVNWVMTKALSGDKHINWLIGSIKHSSFINKGTLTNDKAKNKIDKMVAKNDRTAKYQLGDANGALAALKAKLESSEK